MHVVAIIAAAGQGRRFGPGSPKQLARVAGRTLLERSVSAFARCDRVSEIVVSIPADADGGFVEAIPAAGKPVKTVRGGARRQDSVANAFDAVPPRAEIVVVHDAARALVTPDLIERTIDAAAEAGAAIAAVASRDTVKHARREGDALEIDCTLPRDEIYLAQTPQAFRRDVLAAAVALGRSGVEATDEAMLAEAAGHRVRIVPGDERNIKVTTRDDLAVAEAIARAREPRPDDADASRGAAGAMRVGVGYDLHRLVEGRRLLLGGVEIPFDRGPAGHSDGDAICHALTDAVLGAVAQGDIGRHFPDTDPRWKGANSVEMLRQAVELACAQGYRVQNADVVVILERPKLGPYVDAIRASLAGALGVEVDAISVKGKTNEGVGEIGRGEAIAVHAIAALLPRLLP